MPDAGLHHHPRLLLWLRMWLRMWRVLVRRPVHVRLLRTRMGLHAHLYWHLLLSTHWLLLLLLHHLVLIRLLLHHHGLVLGRNLHPAHSGVRHALLLHLLLHDVLLLQILLQLLLQLLLLLLQLLLV